MSIKFFRFIVVFYVLFLSCQISYAENRELDIFDSESLDDDLGFSDEEQSSLLDSLRDSLSEKSNTLDIGGRFFYENSYFIAQGDGFADGRINHSGTVKLYFDAVLEDDLRFYFQQKFVNALEQEQELVSLMVSELSRQNDVDQLWLKFTLNERYYFTLGKQPTKLGAGFVWQTTDFINVDRFNPLDLSDQRLGVNLLKVQVPFSKQGMNLYAIAQLDNAETLDEIGALLRLEYLRKSAEYALSVNSRKRQALRLGFDVSTGLGLVDWLLSVAVVHNDPTPFFVKGPEVVSVTPLGDFSVPRSIDRSDEWFQQISTGFLFSRSVYGNKTLLVNGEFFYNEAGYENSQFLSSTIISSFVPDSNISFNPLYFSQYYAAWGTTLMGLGSDKDQSIGIMFIANMNDETGVMQLIYRSRPFRDLSVSASAGWFIGESGTFRPNVDFDSDLELDDLLLVPPKYSAQVQLTLSF